MHREVSLVGERHSAKAKWPARAPIGARGPSEDQDSDPEREPHPKREMVGLSGLEPLTSRLSGGRSNQLSYRPEQAVDPSSACHQLNGVEWEGWPPSPCDQPILRRPAEPLSRTQAERLTNPLERR